MTLTIIPIHDHGEELKKHRLVLYSNDYIDNNILTTKLHELHYITDTDKIVGYIQMSPITINNVQYTLIHEIEIFSQYRCHGYGSKIVKYLRLMHEIIPVDIQEHAMGFWFRYLDVKYWKRMIVEYGNINSLVERLSYSDKVKRYIISHTA
jgi:hypothetical protein